MIRSLNNTTFGGSLWIRGQPSGIKGYISDNEMEGFESYKNAYEALPFDPVLC